jgi:hypothetical protein
MVEVPRKGVPRDGKRLQRLKLRENKNLNMTRRGWDVGPVRAVSLLSPFDEGMGASPPAQSQTVPSSKGVTMEGKMANRAMQQKALKLQAQRGRVRMS